MKPIKVKAWAVFGPEGEVVENAVISRVRSEITQSIWWPDLRKDGCTVRKVTITEGWE